MICERATPTLLEWGAPLESGGSRFRDWSRYPHFMRAPLGARHSRGVGLTLFPHSRCAEPLESGQAPVIGGGAIPTLLGLRFREGETLQLVDALSPLSSVGARLALREGETPVIGRRATLTPSELRALHSRVGIALPIPAFKNFIKLNNND